MSMIYFNDGGAFDPSANKYVRSIYAIDTSEELPVGKMALPDSPVYGPAAVSFDGGIYAQALDLTVGSSVAILDFGNNSQKSVAYNPDGQQTKGAGFAIDGRLVVCTALTVATFMPPYDEVVERDLPFAVDGFVLYPDGSKAVLLQSPATAYICDMETLSVGTPINLLQDEGSSVEFNTLTIASDGTKFGISTDYSQSSAMGLFDGLTGDYLGKTGSMAAQSAGYFLSTNTRLVYQSEDKESLVIFDLSTALESLVPLSELDDDPPYSYGYDYSLRGTDEGGYAVLDYYGSLRRVSLEDGSVAATPKTYIEANGDTLVQPIGGPSVETLRYFWTGFLKSYENPVIVTS